MQDIFEIWYRPKIIELLLCNQKANPPHQIYQAKPTNPNLPCKTYQTYQTKPTEPKLPNQTFQSKPIKPNLLYTRLGLQCQTPALSKV